eukprot:scaffold1363_cov356-Prasinococcus_capsulatus_cf.AAC.9
MHGRSAALLAVPQRAASEPAGETLTGALRVVGSCQLVRMLAPKLSALHIGQDAGPTLWGCGHRQLRVRPRVRPTVLPSQSRRFLRGAQCTTLDNPASVNSSAAPDLVHTDLYTIRSSEVGLEGKVEPPALCNLLQELATDHVGQYGLAFEDLKDKETVAWVLSRLRLRVKDWPKWRDSVTIRTWPHELQRLLAIRDFRVFDSDGNEIAEATSSWLCIDLGKKRPVRIPASVRQFYDRALEAHTEVMGMPVPEHAIPDALDTKLDARIEAISKSSEAVEIKKITFPVRRADIDLNRHANNAAFVAWCFESVPPAVWADKQMVDMEISYQSECFYGDTVTSVTHQIAEEGRDGRAVLTLSHTLTNGDGKTLARMCSEWV